LNILVFKTGGKFEFLPDVGVTGSLIVSEVDSVRSDTSDLGLNLDVINYQWPAVVEQIRALAVKSSADPVQNKRKPGPFLQSRRAYTLLRDLLQRDPNHEFYYNCPLQAATAIDINTILTGDDAENLSQPKFWYDSNNINNKFVISELDSSYLDDGIVIAKASKLR
jgi:hypothetical protein